MWGAILSLFNKNPEVGAATFEASLLRTQQAALAEEKSRRNTAILILGVGAVGFAAAVYLVSRK